jgi:hypothetical protein
LRHLLNRLGYPAKVIADGKSENSACCNTKEQGYGDGDSINIDAALLLSSSQSGITMYLRD